MTKKGGIKTNILEINRNLLGENMELFQLLREVNFLKSVSNDTINEILKVVKVHQYSSGNIIIKEGTLGSSLFIIQSGRVEVVKTIASHTEHENVVLKEIKMADFFGEMSLLDENLRSASVWAVTKTIIVELEREDFKRICANNFQIMFDLAVTVTNRMRVSNERYLELRNKLVKKSKMAAIGSAIGGITQDMKNPLSTIELTTELLRAKYPDIGKHADRIENQVRHIESLIKDILNFATRKTCDLNTSDINVNDFWNLINETIKPLLEYKSIKLTISNSFEEIISIDKQKFMRAIINILKNDIEAVGFNANIHILSKRRQNNWFIKISDDGPGIPHEIKDRIFEPFVNIHQKNNSGFGMAICWKTIKEHNGTIVAGNNCDEGAYFEIEIPA